MRVRILVGFALGASLVVSAQTTNLQVALRPMTMRECIDLALSRNLDLRIEHLTTDLVRYDLNGAYGAYSPNLSFTARHDFLDQPSALDVKKTNPDLAYNLRGDTLGPSLDGLLPWGLSYRFGAQAITRDAFTDFNGTESALFYPGGVRHTNDAFAQAGVSGQQHLLRDFWIDPVRERVLVRRKDLKISEQALQFSIMRTVLAVSLGYFELLASREAIGVQEQAVGLKRQFLAETKRRVEVGDLPPLDAAQAETQMEKRLTALAVARETFATEQNALKSLLTDNFLEWADVELQPTDALFAIPEEPRRSESFQNAMKNRPDLAEARLAVEKSDVVVRFSFNQLFPKLDLIGGYGGVGVAPDTGGAIDDAFGFDHPQYFYGVVLTLPLSNVTERNSYRASKAAKEISALQLRKAEQAILVQVANWVTRVQSAVPQLDSTRKARDYAEAALDAEVKKLQNGFSTSFVVLELQEDLTAARLAELQARANYNKAKVQLAFAEGTILERQNLSVEVK